MNILPWPLSLVITPAFSQSGGFETPADAGTLTNFVEIGQARDKILSLKLDQVRLVNSSVLGA